MKKYFPSAAFMAAFLILWQLFVFLFDVESWFLPSPLLILKTLVESSDLLIHHTITTIYETLWGFFASVVTAFILAVVMDTYPTIKKGIYPLLVVSQTIPIIFIAPLLMVWFGYGLLPKIFVVALVCFFPIVVSLVEGLESVDPDMVNLLLIMGATKSQIFRKVRFPAAFPSFFSGLKIAATYSVMGAVIGEWLGASRGIGYFMILSSKSFRVDRVFAAIALISFLSLAFFGLIELASRLAMPWHYKNEQIPQELYDDTNE